MGGVFSTHVVMGLQSFLAKVTTMSYAAGTQQPDIRILTLGQKGSGKTSTLKSLFGLDWLPNTNQSGQTVLCIRLVNTSEGAVGAVQDRGAVWYECDQLPGQRFSSSSSFEFEVRALLMKGTHPPQLPRPIQIRHMSPNVPNLTLIDTPGFEVVDGKVPIEYERWLKELLAHPLTAVLSFVPYHHTAALTHALDLVVKARIQDRSIAIVTGIDTRSSPTAAGTTLIASLLLDRSSIYRFPALILGYNTPDEEFANFFSTVVDASARAKMRIGLDALDTTVAKIVHRIFRQVAPTLKVRITSRIHQLTQRQQSLLEQTTMPTDRVSHKAKVMSLITAMCRNFESLLHGGQATSLHSNALVGGARVVLLLEMLAEQLGQMNPLAGLTQQDVAVAVRNASGTAQTLLVPQHCFEALVRRQIQRMLPHALSTLDDIQREVVVILEASVPQEIHHMPQLRSFIADFLDGILVERVDAAREMVRQVFQMETAHINTGHPDFVVVYNNVCRHLGGLYRTETDDKDDAAEGESSDTPKEDGNDEPPPVLNPNGIKAPPPLQQQPTVAASGAPSQQTKSRVRPSVFEDLMGSATTGDADKDKDIIRSGKVIGSAAAVGMVAGAVAVGPLVGLAAGMGMAAAALRPGKAGNLVRKTGEATLAAWDKGNEMYDKTDFSTGSAVINQMQANIARVTASKPKAREISFPSPDAMLSENQRSYAILSALVQGYFALVRVKIQDMIPKIAFRFIVQDMCENMEHRILQAVFSSQLLQQHPHAPSLVVGASSLHPSRLNSLSDSTASQTSELDRELEHLRHALALLDECKQGQS